MGTRLKLTTMLAAGLVVSSMLHAAARAESPQTADALMAVAHAGRAEWDHFPGFTAQVKVSNDEATATGQLKVGRDGKLELELPDAEKFAWVSRTLNSVIGHRLTEDAAITGLEFADEVTDHPHGRLLRSRDGSDKSLWRVKGDVLTEVHRFSKDSRFTISIGDVWRTAENKHLPRNFCVTTWEVPSGKLKSARQVHYEWTRIGSVDLPTQFFAVTNHSDGTTQTHLIEFFNHQIPETTVSAN